MATPSRDELIAYAKSKGLSDDAAAAKADAYLAAKGEKKADPAPKAPVKPAAKTPEPPKPSPAVAAQAPKVVEKETVRVTAAVPPARVYGAELPDRTREYSDTVPPLTRSRAAEVMPSEVSMTGRGGLWLDRQAAAKAQAEDRARDAAKAPRGVPPAMVEAIDVEPIAEPKSRAPEAMRFSDMGYGLPSVEKMRAELKAKRPESAAKLDAATDEDVSAVYAKVIGG